MKRLRSEDGIALISSIIILFVLLGVSGAMLFFANSQQRSATYQQSNEQAYALAEAALNAQIFQLSVNWPSTAASALPSSCTPSSTATGCPTAANLSAGYPGAGSASCPTNTAPDAWGSSLANGWTTYVRDNGGGTSSLYNSAVDKAQPTWDQAGPGSTPDGTLWVRAVGVVNCREVAVLTKVSAQTIGVTLPNEAVTANGFATSNNGNKVLVDTEGTYAQPSTAVANPSGQPGGMSMRCTGLSSNSCKSYRGGQVYPDTSSASSNPPQTLSASELASVRQAAIVNGTWWGTGSPNGTCPSDITQLTGNPTYVDGPCTLSFTGNGSANSATSPGQLILANGTIEISGNTTFYGAIYDVNQQNATGTPCDGNDVVTMHGNGEIQGSITVDGAGTVCFGSSHTNFVYDSRGGTSLKGFAGAASTPNSFRLLPQGQ